jgi:hypothetical protein
MLACLAFAGDSPLEYPEEELNEDSGEDLDEDLGERRPVARTRPFRLDRVNATFASRHYVVDEDLDEEFDEELDEEPDVEPGRAGGAGR